jgi:hypothetical protein
MLDISKVVFYDSEYTFGNTPKSEWKYHKAKLRIQTIRVGTGPIRVVDVWKEGDIWDEIFDYLSQGYILFMHNAIADIRPDLCDERIIPFILNNQVRCSLYQEKLIHGMTDPIGEWSKEGAVVDEEFEDDENLDNDHKNFSKVFALDALIYRHTGIVVKKLYQDARNYLKLELSEAVLNYCKEDIKYMHKIYENQEKEIERLDLQDIVKLNHRLLLATLL